MPDAKFVKMTATIFSLTGSTILAYRITGILNALTLVGKIHEANINQLMLDDGHSKLTYLRDSINHVNKAQKLPLLIAGFSFVITSGVLHVLVLLFGSHQP